MYAEIEGNMAGFGGNVNDGAIILCMSGQATLKINLTDHEVEHGCEVLLLPDCVCTIMAKSEDFRVVQITLDEHLFFAASRNIEPDFFDRVKNFPVYRHNEKTLTTTKMTLALLKDFSSDAGSRFKQEYETLLVRSLLLKISDNIKNNWNTPPSPKGSNRPAQLYDDFIRLVIHYCSRERKVEWYASKLCISSRYLSEVTSEIMGQSPKQIIDNYAIQEIALLLTHSHLSIKQITDKMYFSDQSTLGRYFKQHTGLSPHAYRSSAPMADI